ncbi:putative DNA repair exonuclease SbcCD [Tetraselmis virus 1]|uniref:Putative DNA repair exonuclease SbcCD n=1 Tax=Tetraselmis virus 1 TaxID=2060617 RepID=A0A2P0VNS2_9VIRU|nr:putative DNA repair exonuclease SbcCD [Tetraselmis virus 1]AUF82554.1 putative DNA repair exonuclease SbcCD [Tetraselmis virus 1]
MDVTVIGETRVQQIVHIADLHVRLDHSRSEEYKQVFSNFERDLLSQKQSLEHYEYGSILLVIAGDIFHEKAKIGTDGANILFTFLNNVSSLCPVIMICGNHDFRQDEPSITDAVEMISNPYKNDGKIFYLKDTGLYRWGNVGIGVVSIKETLRAKNTSGQVDKLRPFPDPDHLINVDLKIALFHGTITKSRMANGINTPTGYPLDWFDGYDYGLFGDNHLQQINIYKDKFFWGYPGSLVQQDFGEPVFGHGFLTWCVSQKNIPVFKHVYNNEGFIKLYEDETVEYAYKTKRSLEDFLTLDNCPKCPKIQCIGDSEIVGSIAKKYFNQYSITKITCLQSGDSIKEFYPQHEREHFGSTDLWIKYLLSKKIKPDLVQEAISGKLMSIPNLYDLDGKNEITKAFESYNSKKGSVTSCHRFIRLSELKYDWIMCYGSDNKFVFDNLIGKNILINGPNAAGKSSFLDCIFIAIYGKAPDREEFMNINRPNGCTPKTTLTFMVDDTLYTIKRLFTEKKPIHLVHDSDNVLHAEGKTKTEEWVNAVFGRPEHILTANVIHQCGIHTFFSKSPSDKQKVYDSILETDTLVAYEDLMKKSLRRIGDHCNILKHRLNDLDFCPEDNSIQYLTDSLKQKNIEIEIIRNELELHKDRLVSFSKGKTRAEKVGRDFIVDETMVIETLKILEQYQDITDQDVSSLENDLMRLNERVTFAHENESIQSIADALDYHVSLQPNRVDITFMNLEDSLCIEWRNQQKKSWLQNPDNAMNDLTDYETQLHGLLDKQALLDSFHLLPFVTDKEGYDDDFLEKAPYVQDLLTRVTAADIQSIANIASQESKLLLQYPQIQDSDWISSEQKRFINDIRKCQESVDHLHYVFPSYASKNFDANYDPFGFFSSVDDIDTLKDILVRLENTKSSTVYPSTEFEIRQWKNIEKVYDIIIETRQIQNQNYAIEALCDGPDLCERCKTRLADKLIDKSHNTDYLSAMHSLAFSEEWQVFSAYFNIISEKIKALRNKISFLCYQKLQLYEEEKHRLQSLKIKDFEFTQAIQNYNELIRKKHTQTLIKQLQKYANSWKVMKQRTRDSLLTVRSAISQLNSFIETYQNWFAREKAVELNKQNVILFEEWTSKKMLIEKRLDSAKALEQIRSLDRIQEKKKLLDKLNYIRNELNARQYDLCNDQYCQYQSSLTGITKDIANIEFKIQQHTDKNALFHRIRDEKRFFDNKFTDISLINETMFGKDNQFRRWLYEEYLVPYLNSSINIFLKEICDFTVAVSLSPGTKKDIHFRIIDRKKTLSIKNSSGYQKFVIDLAIRITLIKMRGNLRHLFIDEGFTSFDECNMQQARHVLKSLNNYCNFDSIIIITHLDTIKQATQHVFNVAKEGLHSRIV